MLRKLSDDENRDACNLNNLSLFKSLCSNEAAELEHVKKCSHFKKNQEVFTEGSYPKGVFGIKSGKIKVFSTGETGKEQIIRIAKEGDVVGFRAMFSEEPYKLSAKTLEETDICFIKIVDFMEHLRNEPTLLQAVLKELSKESGDRAAFIKTMAQKNVRRRLSVILLVLDDVYSNHLINLSREDLANFVGTSTETIIRLLKEFKEEKLVDIQGRIIHLIDIEGLYCEASF